MDSYERVLLDGIPRWVRLENGLRKLLSDDPWRENTEVDDTCPPDAKRLVPATPTKIVCVGRNYAAHAAELGNAVPSEPLLFLKPPSALVADGESIVLPPASAQVEHEGELAVVMGERLKDASDAATAAAAVFGFTVANDVTARDIQRADVQFTRGKGFDTFCPVGPRLVTGVDPTDLAIRVEVGESIRQESRTSNMVWGVYELVAYISRVMTLEAGDLVLTGTPAGVGPLVDGDIVRVVIESVGTLSNPVVGGAR